jgi:hypothetical protein
MLPLFNSYKSKDLNTELLLSLNIRGDFIIMAITYGIISEMHATDVRNIIPVIKILEKEEVDALVLNGDLSGERADMASNNYLSILLDIVGRSGLEAYVLPGSHEVVNEFEPVLDYFSSHYPNLINTLRTPKVEKKDHHLVFLQGADSRAGDALENGYSLEYQNKSDLYKNSSGLIRVINMHDLRSLVSDPEKTIVFSHVPRRFSNLESCVDTAEFGEVQTEFQLNNHPFGVGSVLPGDFAYSLREQGLPIQIKKENSGNETLKTIFDDMGIKKNITGHFHESVGRAHDLQGNPVEEGLFVNELFYNASCMDRLMIGMLTVDDVKVAFENIDLRKYIKPAG